MTSSEQEHHLRAAVELALEGVRTGQGGPFGAVIVRDGAELGRGCNRVLATNDPTAHAEVVAIRAACARLGTFSLAGATLYTSCEPCPMCLAAIHWARIERVVFASDRRDAAAAGFDDELLYRELAGDPAQRRVQLVAGGREFGRAAFEAWRAKADRVPY